MREIMVVADRYLICIKTNCPEVEAYIQNKKDDFQRLTIHFEMCKINTQPDMTFVYMDTPNIKLTFLSKEREMQLSCPWNQINQSTIIPMVFRLMVEWLRQSDKEIKLHASSVAQNDKVSLFIAPSEGGKTSTAMALCHQLGFRLCSNDAAVVSFKNGTPYLLRGDSAFKIRYNGLKAYSNEIYQKKVLDNNEDNSPWFDKMKLSAQDMGVDVQDGCTPVRYVFFVKLDTMVEQLSVIEYTKNPEDLKKRWFKPVMSILQNISGTIRGVDLIPQQNDGTILSLNIPSIDNDNLAAYRVEFVNQLFKSCKVYQLRGRLEDIIKFVNKITKEDEE